MSSSYRRICLSHNPPLVLDHTGTSAPILPVQPHDDHPHCVLALGRFSYPLIEIWLPVPGVHPAPPDGGEWYDVTWMRRYPDLAAQVLREAVGS